MIIHEDGTATFEIAETDELTRQTYIGSFKVKCFLHPLETIRADRIYRELIGPVNSIMASGEAQQFSFAISQLSVRVIEMPEFFKNLHNPDLNGGHLPESILIAVLNKAVEAETKFRKQQKKKFEDTQKRLLKKYKEKKIEKQVEEEEEPIVDKNQPVEEEVDIET